MAGKWDTSTKRLVSTHADVIYLKRCKVPKPHFTWKFPSGKTVHVFQFEVIKL